MMKIEYKCLLKPEEIAPSYKDWYVSGVLNPGAVRLKNKEIVLVVRVAEVAGERHKKMEISPRIASANDGAGYETIKKEDIVARGVHGEVYLSDGTCRLPTISHFRTVILSEDGFYIKSIKEKPALVGIPVSSEYGIEDARITEINGEYFMTYVGVSGEEGVSTYLASSKDAINWKRKGLIFREQNKDVCLFPEKINGRYVALNRPETSMSFSRPGIWISYSRDLRYWGDDSNLMRPRGSDWESSRIGGGAPPIKTKKGWLVLYHGVRNTDKGSIYNAGSVLLDLKNPRKIIARSRSNRPLIKPHGKYEKNGFLDNIVFPSGAIVSLDKKSLLIYSGGSDSITSVRKLPFERIFKNMEFL